MLSKVLYLNIINRANFLFNAVRCYSFLSHLFQVLTLSISSNDRFMAIGMGNLLQISVRSEPGNLEKSLEAAQNENAGLEYHKRYFLQNFRIFSYF